VLFFIPGVLLSRALIGALGQTVFYGTSIPVVVALVLRYVAVSHEGMGLARNALDATLLDAGRMEGASGWTLFRHFAWPQLMRPMAAIWYVIYLLALWDVETLVLIYPPGGETLALRIFNLLHYGHNAQVNAMCVTLLGLAVMPVILWQLVQCAGGLWRRS
jgi:ABC-type Fe3+ transport system permease subunit